MVSHIKKQIFWLPFLSLVLFGCPPPVKDSVWSFDKSEITDSRSTNSEKLNVDIYLDVTGSMEGFSGNVQSSSFGNFLNEIESVCLSTWKSTDIKYYKYGNKVSGISHDDFVSSKNNKSVFTGEPLNYRTEFADAIKNTNSKRVSIMITDLFYKANDPTPVIEAIKNRFNQNVEVGVIGIASDFKGDVGDLEEAGKSVNVNAVRNVYALVFGDKTNINLFFKSLKNKSYTRNDKFLLFANRPVESFDVKLEKDRNSKSINGSGLKNPAWVKYGTIFNFDMKENAMEGLMHLDIKFQRVEGVPAFTEKNIKTLIYKKVSGTNDSVVVDNEIKVINLKVVGQHLTSDVQVINSDPVGKYSYAVYLVLDNTSSIPLPKWVFNNNTASIEGVKEGKTLNLDRLLTDLGNSHISVVQPKLAKFYIYLNKK